MSTLSGNRVVPRVIANASGNRTINLDLLFSQPSCTVKNDGNIVINGAVSGSGQMFISGSGVTELTNNSNTYAGNIVVNGGTLKLSGSARLGGGAIYKKLLLNGNLDYSSSAEQIIGGFLDTPTAYSTTFAWNNPSLIVNGPGRLILRHVASWQMEAFLSTNPYVGYNYFQGSVVVNGGYLSVGDGVGAAPNTVACPTCTTSPVGALDYVASITVNQNGTLEFNRGVRALNNAPGTVSAPITGAGAIRTMSPSWMKFTGKNGNFSGTTTIDSGAQLDLARKMGGSFVSNGTLVLVPNSLGAWNGLDPNFSKTVNGNTNTYTLNTDYVIATGSGENNVTAQIQDAGFGNDASEFTGFVSGRVALVQRGVQTFQTKVTNAINAGASAVIIYNNTTGLTTPSITSSIPVFFITQALGQQLVADMAGNTVSVNVDTGYQAGTLSLPEIFGSASGTGDLAYGGTGTLIVNATPDITISGALRANSGVVRVTSSGAVPNASFGVSSGAALELIGGISHAKNLSVNGTGVSSGGAVRNISGNNTISGNTTLTGTTRINSDADTLTLSSGVITGAFAITFGGAGNISVGSAVNNGGSLTKDGAGTLELTAANAYTGSTAISAGTLKLSAAGSFSQTAGSTVTNSAALVIENDNGTTHARSISGTGTITKNLNTKVIFTGTLSHTGVTTVNAGTFAVGAGSTIGDVSGSTGNFVVNAGGTLEINRSNASTFPRTVSGAGSLVVLGGGTISVNNTLTHTGGTTISAGTLSIGAGSISGDIVNNATLQFNRSDAYTYAGAISGTGNVIKPSTSSGTTTLSGNNSYSGTTTISGGALRIGSSNALGTSIATVTGSGVAVEVTGGQTVTNAFTLNGNGVSSAGCLRSLSDSNVFSGALTLGSASRINSDVGALTLNGNIAGAFGLTVGGAGNTVINGVLTTVTTLTKDGAGTLELTAANTYTSTTTISAGALKLSGVGTVGAGAITNNATLVIENNDNTTIARGISGTGAITKNLNTKVIFTGTLSHTGVTTVNAGTFAVGNGGTTGDLSSGTGNFVINSGATLEINRSNASTFPKAISGAGAIVVLGGGTASFTGALTHTGGTTVSAGTMSIGSGSTTGSITGDIVNNAAVQFNRSDALSYSGIISGTGNLVKAAAGTLTLTGNNSYAGTTTISAGPLRVGHANALGSGTSTVSIASSTALELIGDISFARNISSASGGISSGGGLRNISGNNTFDGNYTQTAASRINSDAGTLTLSSSGTLTGTFALTLGGAGNITVNRPIATSTGSLTKDGAGTVVLAAANTYTGVTTLSGGTTRFALASALYNGTTASWTRTNIVVNTGATFAINVGGTNEFTTANVATLLTNLLTTINNNGLRSGSSIGFDTTNSPSDFTISSNITNSAGTGSGAVGVVKLGTGTLVLSGTGNTYTGGTVINGGTLKAGNATCFGSGTITLNAGATLDRAGFTITNTVVNNGGTVIN